MLIWLKAGAWREGVSELFKAIRMELQSLQPQDSSTIKWNKTASGMTAHVVDTPVVAGGAKRVAPTEDTVGGDASYNGYFKIVDVSDEDGFNLEVIDGADALNTNCGIFYCGGRAIYVVKTTITPELLAGTVYLRVWYNLDDSRYEGEIVAGATIISVANELHIELGTFSRGVDDNRFKVVQRWDKGAIDTIDGSYIT